MEGSLKQPATVTYKFPFRRVHDFRLLSCFIPSRRRLRDKLFLLPSDSSSPGSPSSDGGSSMDVDDDKFFSDEDNCDVAQRLTTDCSSSSLESTLDTTASTTLPVSDKYCANAKSPPAQEQEATDESFVFSAPVLLADNVVVETPSFRTLSDPLLSSFSYDFSGDALAIGGPIPSGLAFSWISGRSRSSSPSILAHNVGGRHSRPLPPVPVTRNAAALYQTRAVWLPLPTLSPDIPTQSTSGGSAISSSSSYSELRFNSDCASSYVSTSNHSMSTLSSSLALGSENGADRNVGPWSSNIHHVHGQLMAPLSATGGLPLPPPSVATQLLPGLRSFEYEELWDATRAFAPECCLEKGAFGAVYRACVKPACCLSNHEFGPMKTVELAVVRLAANDNQTLKEWKSDVQTLAQLPVDKSIGLIQGYCAHENVETNISDNSGRRRVERLLVFEQSPHGTLHDYLVICSRSHSSTTLQQSQLDWSRRISIVLGAARGLLYIHDRAPVQILYRDFKATSVLLDQDYKPRLAGYGLTVTSWPTIADNKAFSTVMKISQAHAKTNVWSFGIVLLEILTGQDSHDASSILYYDEESFVRWAAPFLKDENKLLLILDPCLRASQCSVKGALKLAALAIRCLKKKAARRPRMARVVDTLKTLVPDGVESSTRADQQSNSEAVDKRRATTFGGITFRDAEHRSKFVGQYLSVQGANSAGLNGDPSRALAYGASTGIDVAVESDKRPNPNPRVC